MGVLGPQCAEQKHTLILENLSQFLGPTDPWQRIVAVALILQLGHRLWNLLPQARVALLSGPRFRQNGRCLRKWDPGHTLSPGNPGSALQQGLILPYTRAEPASPQDDASCPQS